MHHKLVTRSYACSSGFDTHALLKREEFTGQKHVGFQSNFIWRHIRDREEKLFQLLSYTETEKRREEKLFQLLS